MGARMRGQGWGCSLCFSHVLHGREGPILGKYSPSSLPRCVALHLLCGPQPICFPWSFNFLLWGYVWPRTAVDKFLIEKDPYRPALTLVLSFPKHNLGIISDVRRLRHALLLGGNAASKGASHGHDSIWTGLRPCMLFLSQCRVFWGVFGATDLY